MDDEIDEKFAYITDESGRKYQVLLLDETGAPVDWDEAATAALVAAYSNAQGY